MFDISECYTSELFCFQLDLSWRGSNKLKGVRFSTYTIKQLKLGNNWLHVENGFVILNLFLKIIFFSP